MSLRLFSSTASTKRSTALRLFSSTAAFTLVEIALVVGILVVLSSIVLVTLNIRGNRAAANNVKRKIDLESIQKALDLRAQETGDSLPENLPTKATCIGNGGSETFDLQSINWTEATPSMDADIEFDVHSCDDEDCSGDSWPGLNFSDPAVANNLAGVSDASFFQYKAEFKDYQYPSSIHTSYIREPGNCTGYTDCYNSLAAWESAQNRNLTSSGSSNIEVVEIGGVWANSDTSPVNISGWTTDAAHYIRIYTAPEARHSGKWDNSKYKLSVSDNSAIDVSEDFVRIDGLQIELSTSSVTNIGGIRVAGINGAEIHILNNIIKGNLTGSNNINVWGVLTVEYAGNGSGRKVKIFNNIIYKFLKTSGLEFGIDIRDGWAAYIYNNTVYGNATGIRRYPTDNSATSAVVVKNNISYGNTDNYDGVFDNANNTNNLSGSSQADAPGANPQNNKTVIFTDTTNEDFRLVSSDAGAKNNGADLSTDTNLASNTDIENQVRPAETFWDIGADEAEALVSDFILKDVSIGLIINPAGSSPPFSDTAYNDFVKGSAPSPLVVSGESNPNNADSGAITYAGGSGSVAYTSQVFSSLCYDLSNDLADYLGTIPKDPKTGTDENTGYLISVDPATKVVCVKAPGAENDEIIENCKR